MTPALQAALARDAQLVEEALDALLPCGGGHEAKLFEAMRYACLGGGKRIRPFLVLEGARIHGADARGALRVAAAIEMVHCYSLVHDDLPAMDDDDMRRGRPTVHRAFDEATAILAGDALLTLAFEVIADDATTTDAARRSELVLSLARAAGPQGMVGGQTIDLAAEHVTLDRAGIEKLQSLKTGALIGFASEAGAILAGASQDERRRLADYAADLGLAFQIADDLLDVEGSAAETGKAVGKDAARGKATFVSLLGVTGAHAEARRIAARAAERVAPLGNRSALLGELARMIVERRS
jgi:farnesyl diphosphate synthase